MARHSQARGRYLGLARQCSSNALSALETSISCDCRSKHSLNLKLPLLCSYPTPTDEDQDIVSAVIFEVAFASASLDGVGAPTMPRWKELEIQTHVWEQKKLPRAETLSKTNFKTSSTNNNTGLSPSTLSPEPSEITNLCGEIDAACKVASQVGCYGLIKADSPLIKHLFRVNSGRHNLEVSSWSGKSLESMLTSTTRDLVRREYRNKHILAVKLASSVLQFSESRWLPEFLTSADIVFMEKADASFFEHPFVIKRLQTDKIAYRRTTERTSGLPHELLFSLGIVLLEVALDQSLDSLRLEPELLSTTAKRDLLTDYELAIKHLNRVEQTMGTHYSQAVRHCLKCEFMSPVLDLGQDEFREEVYRKVVAPLEENVSGLNMKFKAS